jgi:hypothetical protein
MMRRNACIAISYHFSRKLDECNFLSLSLLTSLYHCCLHQYNVVSLLCWLEWTVAWVEPAWA